MVVYLCILYDDNRVFYKVVNCFYTEEDALNWCNENTSEEFAYYVLPWEVYL